VFGQPIWEGEAVDPKEWQASVEARALREEIAALGEVMDLANHVPEPTPEQVDVALGVRTPSQRETRPGD
jgi:hypothetical protein